MRATLPSTFQAQVRSLSVIQSVKCKWFTLIGPSLPRGAFPSLCTDPQATPTIFPSVSPFLLGPDNHLPLLSVPLRGPIIPSPLCRAPYSPTFPSWAPSNSSRSSLLAVSPSLTCLPKPPCTSSSHPEPNVAGRAVRFLLVTRGHHGLARPFVAPMSATSRPWSDTRGACVVAVSRFGATALHRAHVLSPISSLL